MIEQFAEFTPGYSVSSFGRIRNDKRGTFRKPQDRDKRKLGYLGVYLNGSNWFVHRLVAKYFVYNYEPETFNVVNHIDNNPSNNIYTNLEWGTQKMNIQHCYRQGKHTSQTSKKFKSQQNEPGKPTKVGKLPNSGVPGIRKIKAVRTEFRYLVYFNHTGKSRYLGSFDTLQEAEEVHRKAYFELYKIYPEERTRLKNSNEEA